MFVPLATSGYPVPVEKFWNAVLVYHNRPHIVNKKIAGISQAYFYKVQTCNIVANKINELFTYASLIYEVRKLPQLTKQCLSNVVRSIMEPYDKNFVLYETDLATFRKESDGLFISLRIMLPKQSSLKRCIEVVILDKGRNCVTFHTALEKNESILAPPFPYTLELTSDGHLRIVIESFEDAESSSSEWLIDKLFHKLLKWTEDDDLSHNTQVTVSLVSLETYIDLYQHMKVKYGQKTIDMWPESTDPLKFVYEDVAIASYLICLWREMDPERKPTFVDLGCGNGLLVNILNQEGFHGIGIDVRKRKIWDLYPDNVKLEVRTLLPSSASLFPEADWIIGNHSDELTPWIPVVAARSSPKTNFFVLPCCSYDFNGQKYIRTDTSRSQYNEYLEYVMKISQKCGFIAQIDKLRIPSTKKTCIVSIGRTYSPDESERMDNELTNFINTRSKGKNIVDTSNWINDFEAREQVEKVRNCTKLDKTLIDRIVRAVLSKLLEQKNFLEGQDQQGWNAGGTLAFNQLVVGLNSDDLKQLKCECGGLQTLLRNHRYIFEVVKGTVKIRVPSKYSEVTKYKDKPCWFAVNHPDGCLNDAVNCAYKHL